MFLNETNIEKTVKIRIMLYLRKNSINSIFDRLNRREKCENCE